MCVCACIYTWTYICVSIHVYMYVCIGKLMHMKYEMLILAPCDTSTLIFYILYTRMKFPNVILCRQNLHNQKKSLTG